MPDEIDNLLSREVSPEGEKVVNIAGGLPSPSPDLAAVKTPPVADSIASSEVAKDATPEKNVIFVGKTEAPTWRRSGPDIFNDLPDSDTQKKGFYYERARLLIRAFPREFKAMVRKG